MDAFGIPLRVIITKGTTADCKKAESLIDKIKAKHLLADRGYDSNSIIEKAREQGTDPVIPPKRNRIEKRNYDKDLYKLRHLVENAFLNLKQWRGIATRYAKKSSYFLAAVHIRCMIIWGKII